MSEQELLNQIITLLWRRDWRTEANRSEIDGLLMRLESRIKARAEPEKVEPEGWKLVPAEPTEEMLIAGYLKHYRLDTQLGRARAKDDYRAMLAAAAPQQEQK